MLDKRAACSPNHHMLGSGLVQASGRSLYRDRLGRSLVKPYDGAQEDALQSCHTTVVCVDAEKQ